MIFQCFRGRYYYWDTSNDTVCWHSPRHPKANVGKPAAELREKLTLEAERNEQIRSAMPHLTPAITVNRPDFMMDIDKDRGRDRESRDSRSSHDNRFKKPDFRERRRRNRDDDELDPMDPSSYSDVPR